MARQIPFGTLVMGLVATAASAQTNNPAALDSLRQQPEASERLNRVSVTYRAGFLVRASFKRLGGFAALTDPGAATGIKQSHIYDDGHVVPDTASPENDHFTWNWGFKSPSQVSADGDTAYGYLDLHSSSSAPTASTHEYDDPQQGFEIAYSRQLGKLKRLRWGVEGAFNFTDVTVSDTSNLQAPVLRITDRYLLEGLSPYFPAPAPPHTPYTSGTPPNDNPFGGYPNPVTGQPTGGGGPLILDHPASRSMDTISAGGTISGRRSLETALYGWRLGPYLEYPLTDRLSVFLNGGLALAIADSDVHCTETVTISGVGTKKQRRYASSQTDLMVGGYVGAAVSYALSDSVGLSAGVQYQDLGVLTQSVGGKQAQLDLAGNLFLSLGISYSF